MHQPFKLADGDSISPRLIVCYSVRMITCTLCSREYVYSRKAGHRKYACNTCLVNKRRKMIDSKALEYKGGKCTHCGYNKCKASLHFHHLDPNQKEFKLSGNWGLSWSKIKKELDKCELVCANCHGEIHSEI